MDTHARLQQLLRERGWTEYKLSKECGLAQSKLIADALPTSRMEVMQKYYHGDLSINHSEEYAEKLLKLISM